MPQHRPVYLDENVASDLNAKIRPHPDDVLVERRHGGSCRARVRWARRARGAADRREVGHREGDYIVGAGNRSAIGTLVERSTRHLVLVHLGHDRSAVALRRALTAVFGAMPPKLRVSLTWDLGKGMAGHLELTREPGTPVYFCHAHSLWQRASNENMNGLLRDYFPKHTDLRGRSAERLTAVAAEINTRPRKTLDWATPADLFTSQRTPG